jgi:hypothetical protein
MTDQTSRQLKSGILDCWLSLGALPLGLLPFLNGGPCAGPHNIAGSAVLFGAGACAVGAAIYSVLRVLRSIKGATTSMRLLGTLSACCGGFVGLVGGLYLFLGVLSLQAFLP